MKEKMVSRVGDDVWLEYICDLLEKKGSKLRDRYGCPRCSSSKWYQEGDMARCDSCNHKGKVSS